MTGSIEAFQRHIGKKTVTEDLITAMQVQKLAVTLNRHDPVPQPGDPVPPHWHHIFFRRLDFQDEMERDAAPVELDDAPEPPFPVRMYAGSRLTLHQPLRIGETAVKEQEIASVTPKEGRSGTLVFATFLSRYIGPKGLALEEERSMVYREEDTSGGPRRFPTGRPGPAAAAWKRIHAVDEVMLFRYSAVTFNPHRIHYDHPYVTKVEGYPSLLIHGPLTATLLVDLARDNRPEATITTFEYRATAPLWVNQPVTVLGEPGEDGRSAALWALSPEGNIGMEATVTYA